MYERLRLPSMTLAAMLALAASLPLAHAQGVYRIVGQDGRVTYSDQPPPGGAQNGRIDVLRPPATTVHSGAGRAGQSAVEASPPPAVARPAAHSRAAAPDDSIEAAVIGVLGLEDAVRRTETICVSTQPASARRYSAAVDDWARRNARPVLVARQTLSRAPDARTRDRIEEGVRQANVQRFEALGDATDGDRVAWCDRSVAEIAAGRMDVHDKPRLVGPLANLPIR